MPKTALGGLSAKLASIRAGTLNPSEPKVPTVPAAAPSVVVQPMETPAHGDVPEPALDGPEDDSLFLLLESDGEGSDEDKHREDLMDEFRESLRGDEEENEGDVDPDLYSDDDSVDMTDPSPNSEGSRHISLEELIPHEVVTSDLAPEVPQVEVDEDHLLQIFEAFYKINPSPTDEQFHSLAESLGLPHEQLEEALFKLIGESMSDESIGEHSLD